MPSKASPFTPPLTNSEKQQRFQQKLRGFRDEALEQRERVARVENKLDALLDLLRDRIDLPKAGGRHAAKSAS